jgi:nitroreductase
MEPDNAHRMQWLIEHRHSTRVPFDPIQRVSDAELEQIVDAARWAPTAHNMQNYRLVVVDDRETLQRLGKIEAPISPTFIAENYRQLSWSPEELARRGTGLLGTMFPPSWWTADPAAAPRDAARSLATLVGGAPMVIVVVFDPTQRAPASEGDVLGLISLGCVLENMWLAAQACGLDVQILSTLSTDAVEPEVERVLAIPPPWRIAYALRLGHAAASDDHARVRRQPEAFVHRNRFA